MDKNVVEKTAKKTDYTVIVFLVFEAYRRQA